jgi:hypothetical protein
VKDHCSDIERRVIKLGVIAIKFLPSKLDIDAEMVLCSDIGGCKGFKGVCGKVVIIVKRRNLMN